MSDSALWFGGCECCGGIWGLTTVSIFVSATQSPPSKDWWIDAEAKSIDLLNSLAPLPARRIYSKVYPSGHSAWDPFTVSELSYIEQPLNQGGRALIPPDEAGFGWRIVNIPLGLITHELLLFRLDYLGGDLRVCSGWTKSPFDDGPGEQCFMTSGRTMLVGPPIIPLWSGVHAPGVSGFVIFFPKILLNGADPRLMLSCCNFAP